MSAMKPRVRRASELSERGDVNVYLVDPERLSLSHVQEAVDKLYPDDVVKLHVLFNNKVNLSHIIQHSTEVKRQLIDFDPETDRLIIVGRSMANFLAGWVMGLMGYETLTILLYLFETGTYEEMVFDNYGRIAQS